MPAAMRKDGGRQILSIPHRSRSARWAIALLCGFSIALAGCKGRTLPLTPNLYASGENPFLDLPESLRTTDVEILYVTDREPIFSEGADITYGAGRSPSVAFGQATVSMGEGSWEDLLTSTLDRRKSNSVPIAVTSVEELFRFPSSITPPVLIDGQYVNDPQVTADRQIAKEAAWGELATRLAASPTKDVYIYVHGIRNGFRAPLYRMAQLWHMMGRTGVPVAYAWPANPKLGFLRSYTHDRESGEFTVFHFRRALEVIAGAYLKKSKLGSGAWIMTGIDCEGFDLRRSGTLGRVEFDDLVQDAGGARVELVRLAKLARKSADNG